jgi:hypothetical protein
VRQLLQIVPPEAKPGLPMGAQGTKVLTEDGTEVGCVTAIRLEAKVGDIWRAQIDCFAQVGVITARADVRHSPAWRRTRPAPSYFEYNRARAMGR